MKKLLPASLCAFILLVLLTTPVHADIIPKDMKPIFIEAVLTNLDDFPDYTFVQVELLGGEIRSKHIIREQGVVHKGYKLNRLEILAIPNSMLGNEGTLDKIDLLNAPEILHSKMDPVEVGQQLVARDSTLSGKEIYYRVSLTNGTLGFEKTGEKEFTDKPNYPPINLFFWAFLATFAAELLVFLLLLRFVFRTRTPKALRAVLSVLAAQVATLPVLWFLINHFNLMGTPVIFGAEAFAVGMETVIYRFLALLNWRRAFAAALLCNAASYALGLMV